MNTIVYNYTDNNGCHNSDTVTMTVNGAPVVEITTNLNTAYCQNDSSILLNATPSGGTFSGNGISGSRFWPDSATPGAVVITYSYTDVNNCSSSDSITTQVYGLPGVTLGSFTPVCENAQPLTLTGGSPAGGTFSGNGITASGTFYPAIAGTGNHNIIYSYTDTNGCTSSDTSAISVRSLPSSLFTIPASVCLNDSAAIVYTGAAGQNAVFNWYFDNGTVKSGTGAGPYGISWDTAGVKQVSLTVTDSGCTSQTTSKLITVNNALAQITAVGNTSICYGDSLALFANSGAGYSWQWYDTSGILQGDTLSFILQSKAAAIIVR
jgi:hypothetical protein